MFVCREACLKVLIKVLDLILCKKKKGNFLSIFDN